MDFRPPTTLTTRVSPLYLRLTDSSECQPYLEFLPNYIDGAPPWTPTNRGHGITSRPLKLMELRPNHIPMIFNQPSNIYHAHKSHANLYNQSSFIFHVESIPTHPSQSMYIEVYFISTPCHFNNQPSHLEHMSRSYQTYHSQPMNHINHA